MKLPVSPYPSIGEIVYEIAVRSGLVLSTDNGNLYDDLKAFKDDRKRPGLDPIAIPTTVLFSLEARLADYLGDRYAANVVFVAARRWLEYYAGFITRHDAGLLERCHMTYLLWPTIFGFGGYHLLKLIHQILPIVQPTSILADPAPFGCIIKSLCTWGRKDYNLICEHRANEHQIDVDNCRDTLDGWLKGPAVPNLDRGLEVLRGLGLDQEVGPKLWIVAARLLAKTPLECRKAISNHFTLSEDSIALAEEAFFWRKREFALEHTKGLNIGPDRPYSALREALYNPDIPRDAAAIEDMLERLERTWAPIAGQTYHITQWFRGRYHVLCGQYEKALEHYQAAYNLGVGRDPDIFKNVLTEALALAGKLGKKKLLERYDSLVGMHWATEWDGDPASLPELFDRKFDPRLFYS
ncbi:hypothetical protein FQZ97_665310 [compost metagenome]